MNNTSETITSVGFVGLGDMGEAIARRIQDSTFELRVFDLSPEKVEAFVQRGAVPSVDLDDLARNSDSVHLCVGTDDEVEGVYPALISSMSAGSVLVIHSTAHPDLVKRIAVQAKERGVQVIDVPVAGGRPGAVAGTLTLMTGGDEAAIERLRPVLELFGVVYHIGELGTGVTMKALNNYLVSVQLEILHQTAKAIHGLGIDQRRALEVLSHATSSTVVLQGLMRNWAEHEDGTVNVVGKVGHRGGPVRSATMMTEVVEHARDLMVRSDALQPQIDSLAAQGINLSMTAARAAEAKNGSGQDMATLSPPSAK
jgi:3-hydroxyisobutyrate dehydrogenase